MTYKPKVLSVIEGGTSLATLTTNALYVGNGTSAPTALAVAATGNILISNTATAPSWSATLPTDVQSNITSTGNLGNQLNTTRSAFNAYAGSVQTSVTGDNTVYTVIFSTELFDQNNNFDATSTFTAPVTGIYQFNCNILFQGTAAGSTVVINLVIAGTSAKTYTFGNTNGVANGGNAPFGFSHLVKMTATDTAKIQVNVGGGAKTISVYGDATSIRTWFSGFLVC